MAVDLFSMVLNAGISWGVSRLLDTVVNCTRCGNPRIEDITNQVVNSEYCSNCGNSLAQYVNASQHTVNRNLSVVGAHVSNLHWPGWRDSFQLYYDLDVVNSKYESVVVKLQLSRFNGGVFHEFDSTLKPAYESTRWTDTWIKIPRSNFPEEPGVIAVDLTVYNLWGDYLSNTRELMEYGMNKGGGDCFLTTAACRLNGHPDDCVELAMARTFRERYLARHYELPRFRVLYAAASRSLLATPGCMECLSVAFDTHVVKAAFLVENGEDDEAHAVFLELLQNLNHALPSARQDTGRLITYLKNGRRTTASTRTC